MTDDRLEKWRTVSSKYLVEDEWMTLRADSCVTPEGAVVEPYYVIERCDWTNCLVIDRENQALMVRHYRHGVERYLLELVSGSVEASDPNPQGAMLRELEEEIGYVGGEMYALGASYPTPANQTNKVFSFLAVGGSCEREPNLEPSETLFLERLSLEALVRILSEPSEDEVLQSMHLATMFRAMSFIGSSKLDSLDLARQALSASLVRMSSWCCW